MFQIINLTQNEIEILLFPCLFVECKQHVPNCACIHRPSRQACFVVFVNPSGHSLQVGLITRNTSNPAYSVKSDSAGPVPGQIHTKCIVCNTSCNLLQLIQGNIKLKFHRILHNSIIQNPCWQQGHVILFLTFKD
ncbi:hypothetical protein D3C79_857640 [compost metagenome]